MKLKEDRIETIKMLISSKKIGSQKKLLDELKKEGFELTQATLSRDLKQLKVAKAASMNGKYVYVLPNETMYRRVYNPASAREMMHTPGLLSINFPGNVGVIKARPGYASSIAYNLDSSDIPEILETIVGDDTIFIVVGVGVNEHEITDILNDLLLDM